MTILEIEATKHSKKVYEGVIKPTPFIDGMCHGGRRGFIEGAEWMKEKAIEAHWKYCPNLSKDNDRMCRHLSHCDKKCLYMNDFIKQL